MMNFNKMYKLQVMQEIIADLEKQIQPTASGHIHTTISTLRAEETRLINEINDIVNRTAAKQDKNIARDQFIDQQIALFN